MADPFSTAASILGVAATGFKVAKALYSLADGIGSAGAEVRAHAAEVDAFARLLRKTRDVVLPQPGHAPLALDTETLLRDVLDICDRVLAPLARLQTTLRPLLDRWRGDGGKLRQFGLRVRWVFAAKAELLFYRDALRGQHRILDTTLELMVLQMTKDRSPQYIFVLQTSLENCVAALSEPKAHTAGLPQITEGLARLPARLAGLDDAPSASAASAASAASTPAPSVHEGEQEGVEPGMELGLELGLEPWGGSSPDDHRLSEAEAQEMDNQIAKDLDPDEQASAAEVWEDMRVVSRKLQRMAKQTLKDPQGRQARPAAQPSRPTQNPLDRQTLPRSICLWDSFGEKKYWLPFDACLTWKNIHDLVKTFPVPQTVVKLGGFDMHGYTSNVQSGAFEIQVYANAETGWMTLLPMVWEQGVTAMREYRLVFDDSRHNTRQPFPTPDYVKSRNPRSPRRSRSPTRNPFAPRHSHDDRWDDRDVP